MGDLPELLGRACFFMICLCIPLCPAGSAPCPARTARPGLWFVSVLGSRLLTYTSPPEELGCLPPFSPMRRVVRHQPEMEKIKHAFQSPFSSRHHESYSIAPKGFSCTYLVLHSNKQTETIGGILKMSTSFLLNAENSLFLPDENFFLFFFSSLLSDSKRTATHIGQVSLCFASISRFPLT